MMYDKSKIVILTTVINWDLYKKSSQYFPAGIQKYVIDGREGMFGIDSIYFMMEKFEALDVDWLIMADEDVLFLYPEGIYKTMDYMLENNFILSGVRDGGDIPNRTYSPYLINTFFSIVNLKKLKSIWNKVEVKKNHYILENEFEEDYAKMGEKYDVMSLYEPYYCFYFWLRRKGEKILFLESEAPFEDKITTLAYTPDNKKLFYHTWYARSYGNNKKHTVRIDKVFDLLTFHPSNYEEPIIWKDNLFFIKRFLRKQKRRVEMKLEKIYKK
ncbi:hypothetical protein [Flavobacterium limnosediminis]|uniref:hypothetical protein n=1 Tax=Flavobacterium limnosediminis TaxID=1401027 RepID=UPI0003FA3AD3|nr:hypothetical protein [Flavobacterium limnosediminis]